MIIRTPLRLSLVGGGSDLRYFYKNNLGMSLGFPIKYYNYVFFSNIGSELLHIISDKENIETSNPNSIKDNIIKSIFTKYHINKKKIFIFSDLPYGTGLGSSSAMCVSFINAISKINNLNMSKSEIAEEAYKIEEKCSGSTVGKQDHFMSCHGGINLFEYKKDSTTHVENLNLTENEISNIESHMILIRVGGTRNATEILHDQKNNLTLDKSKLENMKKIITYIPQIKKSIINADFKEMGGLISETWDLKKTFSKYVSNNKVDKIYKFLMNEGIYGGKLLGAGTSGYFLAICNPKIKKKIANTFKHDNTISIKVDMHGTKIESF